ncbi:MAG: hypothetical protein LBV74_22835 [Tannerella sp.]|jgi:hypothetical protein|nr:hypothetical protein [Tannerella sp.]
MKAQMKTQVNGVEITTKMADVLDKWSSGRSYDDTVPYYYVEELGKIQDMFCRMLDNSDDQSEVLNAISIIIALKDDLRGFIPDKDYKKEGGVS